MKGVVRAGYKPLAQMRNHVSYLNQAPIVKTKEISTYSIYKTCSHFQSPVRCLKKLHLKETTLSPECYSYADSFILLKTGEVGKVKSIHDKDSEFYFKMAVYTKRNFFLHPLESREVGIYVIYPNETIMTCKTEDLFSKLMILPYNTKLVAMCILHTCNSF